MNTCPNCGGLLGGEASGGIDICDCTPVQKILGEVRLERQRQNNKWGGPKHDDKHVYREWPAFILEYAAKAMRDDPQDEGYIEPANFRRRMIQIAALAVAAVEYSDRKTKPK